MSERQLLGDHPAHRDADHVCALEPQHLEQAGGVPGHLDDRERSVDRRRETDPPVVEGDDVEALLERPFKGSPQETCVPLIPWISSNGSPEPARS